MRRIDVLGPDGAPVLHESVFVAQVDQYPVLALALHAAQVVAVGQVAQVLGVRVLDKVFAVTQQAAGLPVERPIRQVSLFGELVVPVILVGRVRVAGHAVPGRAHAAVSDRWEAPVTQVGHVHDRLVELLGLVEPEACGLHASQLLDRVGAVEGQEDHLRLHGRAVVQLELDFVDRRIGRGVLAEIAAHRQPVLDRRCLKVRVSVTDSNPARWPHVLRIWCLIDHQPQYFQARRERLGRTQWAHDQRYPGPVGVVFAQDRPGRVDRVLDALRTSSRLSCHR